MIQNRSSCYCAFCKNTRKVYTNKHLSLAGIVGLVLLSYVMTFVIWHQPDARGLIILGIFLLIGETTMQMRWRQSLMCQHCGFDPVLYVKNPDFAAAKIKEHLKVRSEKPEYLLKPALNLPKRKAPIMVAEPLERAGANLSLRG